MPLVDDSAAGPAPSEAAPPPASPATRANLLDALMAAAAVVALDLALVPATVNGDGLGYLRAATETRVAGHAVLLFLPGHLLYVPLLQLLARLTGRLDALSLLPAARALSISAAAIAVALVYDSARRLAGSTAARVAALGLAVSCGALQAGSDVESYAPATCAVALTLWCAVRARQTSSAGWRVAAGLAGALAALLHVENVLLLPATAVLCATAGSPPLASSAPAAARRFAPPVVHAATVLAAAAVGGAACYAFATRGMSAPQSARWLLTANHGFGYPLRPWTPIVALYGIGKTLSFAAYPQDSSWPVVVAQSTIGVTAATAIAWLAWPAVRARVLGAGVAATWLLPYALVGLVFFPSDNERWVLLLPPVWALAGAGAARRRVGKLALVGLIAPLAVVNVALGLAAARDSSVRDRADAAAVHLRDGDLLIAPGHGWDEYVGFYHPVAIQRFPLIYFSGLLGGAAPVREELGRRVEWTRAAGRSIYLARGHDDPRSPGWKDLAQFGIEPSNVDGILPAGARVPVAVDLVRIDPR